MEKPCGSCHESVYATWCRQCIPSPDPKRWTWPVLNPVQTAAWKLFEANPLTNLVVATGTGTGKTACAEFALARLTPPARALVMEPLKALAREKVQDWSHRFPHLRFIELTSDADLGQGKERNDELLKYDVIVCSYEMLDSMTRRPTTYTVLDRVRLLVVDEVHELGDVNRGGGLDGALTRFLLGRKDVQVIALSATFDNVEHLKAYLEQFVTPVEVIMLPFAPIRVHVKPDIVPYLPRHREEIMVQEIESLAAGSRTGGGILAMCLSIPSVERITSTLNGHRPGMAVAHYSELSAGERHDVEDLYRAKGARVIVSTPTLLAGINIPCESIVLDVSYFNQDTFKTDVLPVTKIRQAVGRVGRLPWYKEGWITYVCQRDVLEKARTELAKPMIIQGTLLNAMDAVINTEVQLFNVTTRRTLLEWYERTFSRFSSDKTAAWVEAAFDEEVQWLAANGFMQMEDRVTGKLRGTYKGLVCHQHMIRPRWLVDTHRITQGWDAPEQEDTPAGATTLLQHLLELSSISYCPFNWTGRKTENALRIMGYQKVLNGGELDWSAKDEAYQWVRDVADNVGRVTSAMQRLRLNEHDGYHTLELLSMCFAKGCVPPKIARLSRLLNNAGVKGVGYKRLLFLYANGLTSETVADGKLPSKFGLPKQCRAETLFDARPEDFYDWSQDYHWLIPQNILDAVAVAIGRHAI